MACGVVVEFVLSRVRHKNNGSASPPFHNPPPLPLPRALQLIAVKRMAVPIVSPTLLSVRDDHALARQNAQPTSTNASHQPQAAASASAASEQARRVERLHAEIELMREVGRNGSVAPKDLSGLFWSRHNEKSRGSRR